MLPTPQQRQATRVQTALALALFAGLLAAGAASTAKLFNTLDDRFVAAESVRHTLDVIVQTEETRAGIRGPADPARQLTPAEREAAITGLAKLDELTRDNPRQQAEIARLRALAADPASMSVAAIDDGLLKLRRKEDELLERRSAERQETTASSMKALRQLVVLLLVMLAGTFIAGQLALRARARNAIRDNLQGVLERRVAERTAELEEANRRLLEEAAARAASDAKLRHVQKMESIGQLSGGIAHDFNNMLAIVAGGIELARRRIGNGDTERAIGYLDNADDGARRAAQLTQRLLAFARQQPLAPEVLDVNQLVGTLNELLRRTIPEAIQIETVLAGGLWRACADRGELENAILNLALNARDAMVDGGRLTLETANTHLDEGYAAANPDVKAGQYLVICVTDTGEGMDARTVERAFDPFFTTKPHGKGTGLGLSQVFGFAKQSGGHASIYSEIGMGTTAKLYLPRHMGNTEPSAATVPMEEIPRARAGETVLLVEDEAGVRELSADTLRELGYGVVTAASGEEALPILAGNGRLDLLFTDVVMTGMTGAELAARAKELRPGLPVLFTTGYTRNSIVHNGMLDPDVALVSKPFTVRQLAAKLREVLGG